jgi:glycosyltransferase involved in cell wall biosynthesis
LRIAYLSQYFPPEPAAPAARVHEFGRAWVQSGAQVTVLTAFPNFPTGVVPARYGHRLAATESLDGLRVQRSWILALPNRELGQRGAVQLSFLLSTLAFGAPRLGAVDVVVASSPPLFVGLAGWLLARWRQVPFVLEVRDLWPEAALDLGLLRTGSPAARALAGLATFLYRRATRVVVVTDGFLQHLARQGVPAERLAVVPNGADLRLFGSVTNGTVARRALGFAEDGMLATYLGSLGVAQGLDVVLDAAAALPDVCFALIGDGSDRARLIAERDRRGLNNVRLLPSVPRAQVPSVYAASDIAIVPLRDVPIFSTFVPSKLFELLAAGRPIVGALRGEARDILERSGAAVLVEPDDGASVATAVARLARSTELRTELGARGRAFAAAHYDRDQLAARYLRLLDEVVRGRA